MAGFCSEFLKTLEERGFIHQCSDPEGLDALLKEGVVTAYIGFDCTAPSLHAGSLLPIMMLRWFQRTGHRPIVLLGGGTTKIPDPTGKDESRPLLSSEQIAANKEGIAQVFAKFLTFGNGPTDAIMVDNADWLDELRYVPLLRDIGRHFSVNRMLTMDSVRLRLEREQPLSFIEFNYMVLQAYDFLELYRRHGCRLQMGGSDQWGNIIMGAELGRRVEQVELFALTAPLLTTSAGEKMGKSAGNAVWLNADMLPPYEYWQYWRNTADADVGRFLKLFTELPLEEIARLEKLQGAELNEAKKVLASEATALLHGRAAAEEAALTARKTFEQGARAEGLPTITVPWFEIETGMLLPNLLHRARLTKSTSEARRLIREGGVRLNNELQSYEQRLVTTGDLDENRTLKLSVGKKRHVLVRAD